MLKRFSIFLIIGIYLMTLTGCKRIKPKPEEVVKKEIIEEEMVKEVVEKKPEFPIEIPPDEEDPLFFDGLDAAFEVLKEYEG